MQTNTFAQMMITDHQNANAMLTQEGYAKAPNSAVNALEAMVNEQAGMLRGKTGTDFDRAYMTSQVDMHMKALDTVKNNLQPSAQDKDLRNILSTMRTSVEMHLQRARQLQGMM